MKTLQLTAAPTKPALLIALGLIVAANPALAYVGPGLGLATLGAILGGIAALFLAIIGVFWYPIRSMIRKRRAKADGTMDEKDAAE